jgi:predicted RND superfamily exporter protein
LTSRFESVLAGVARAQAKRPLLALLLALSLLLLALVPARKLELRTDLAALAPEDDPAITEIAQVLREVGVGSKLYVVFDSDSPTAKRGAARACADAIAPRIRAIGAPITSARTGIQETRAFLLERALLFATVGELQRVQAALAERRERATIGAFVGNLDDEPTPPLDVAPLRKSIQDARGWMDRLPDGYYEAADGKGLVLVVTTSVPPADLVRTEPALREIRAVVDAGMSDGVCRGLRAGYAGDLLTGFESYRVVKGDLLGVGVVGVALVLAVVLLFFLRVRAVVGMALSLAVGLSWTFGLAALVVGHLNVATGFLFSIIAGNSLNVGIIFTFRAFEEARRGAPFGTAVATANAATWRATLGGSAASAASYASLAATGFRALVEFAIIGGGGMLLCWLATYLVLPPFLVMYDRRRPFRDTPRKSLGELRTNGIPFGRGVARVVERGPRVLALAAACVVVFGAALGVRQARRGIVDRDLRRLRSDLVMHPERARDIARASEILGSALDAPILVRAKTAASVPLVKRALEERRDREGSKAPPFGEVHSLSDLVAPDQERKIPSVLAIRRELMSARRANAIDDAAWAEVAPTLPPPDLKPYSALDLPDDVLPAATAEARSRIVVVERAPGATDYDLDEITRLAEALRDLRLPDGSVVRGTGRAMIFSEMLHRTFDGMPRALALSLLTTILVVALTLRSARATALVLVALALGIAGMALGMGALDMKLNLFSVMAIPVAFGIGADYALNLVQRASADGPPGKDLDLSTALRGVGSAILLCSATTTLGYSALVGSVNPAIRSFGVLSVLGEISCICAAALGLPALVRALGGMGAEERGR